jgi:hypothetical protein
MSHGISDGDLVRLARDGDAVAFRLLVERHLPMARTRARRLCANLSCLAFSGQGILRLFTRLPAFPAVRP